MALIKCVNCGHLISDKAQFCPKCRFDFSVKNDKFIYGDIVYLIVCVILIIGLFVVLYFI